MAKLSAKPTEARTQLRNLRERGFKVVSVQTSVHSLFPDRLRPEPKDPIDRMRVFVSEMDLFVEHWPDTDVPFVVIGGAAPGYDFRLAWETAEELLPELLRHAERRGVRLAFEPIHPIFMHKDTFICALDETLALISRFGLDRMGYVLDVFHLWQEPDLLPRLCDSVHRLMLIHLSDFPRYQPRALDDRLIPGTGIIPLRRLLNGVLEAGYGGPVALEVLSDLKLPDSLWRADPAEVIDAARRWYETACLRESAVR